MKRIFVFGSNLAGQHLGGAAAYAVLHHGAKMGQSEGLQGESYALPTMDEHLRPLPMHRLSAYAAVFCAFARSHPELRFQLTKVGCGIAGNPESAIAPLFVSSPPNVALPEGWDRFS